MTILRFCTPRILYLLLTLCAAAGLPASQPASQNNIDESGKSQSGLLAKYTIGDQSHFRADEDILFSGAIGSDHAWHADPRLPSAPFRVRWVAKLNIVEPGKYQFHFHGNGNFQLWLDGAAVLSCQAQQPTWHLSEVIELPYGPVDFEAEYESAENPAAGLFWSSNIFQLEPLETSHFTRPIDASQKPDLAVGRALSRALRCQACHEFERNETHLPAPSLTRLAGNLKPDWLIDHLMAQVDVEAVSQVDVRRMPYYGLSKPDATAITRALMENSEPSPPPENWAESLARLHAKRKSKEPPIRTTPDRAQAQQTFASQGCIACHRVGELGLVSDQAVKTSELFAGGDLSHLSTKRPSEAIARWLSDPMLVNADHRMPVFELTLNEKLDLHAWLQNTTESDSPNEQAGRDTRPTEETSNLPELVAKGRSLIEKHQCGACHNLPASLQAPLKKSMVTKTNPWDFSCLQPNSADKSSGQVSFRLEDLEVDALKAYLQSADSHSGANLPDQLIVENNCLSCHRRGAEPGLFKHFIDLSENFPDLASRLAAMTPPALGGIGDKLHRESIAKAIGNNPERLRPWLDIRMPKFRLSQEQIDLLSDHFISHDRIPDNSTWPQTKSSQPAEDQSYWLAAGRLVTPDGFSCQSCHPIADSKPAGIALNAHGTDLTMLGRRIREPWFYRWVKNPSRIVPRMEMPAIQTPVHGVLGDSLDNQLQALWLTLNRPDFQPPKPNPVRVIRNYNDGQDQHAHVLTDVIESPTVVIRPLVMGLTNRHNVMIDLSSGGLNRWWIGDVARQHTRGKSWYWEPGAPALLKESNPIETWKIIDTSGAIWTPTATSEKQFAMELDKVQHIAGGVRWNSRLHFSDPSGKQYQTLRIEQQLVALDEKSCSLQTTVQGLRSDQQLRIETPGVVTQSSSPSSKPSWQGTFESGHNIRYVSIADVNSTTDNTLDFKAVSDGGDLHWESFLSSAIVADRFVRVSSQKQTRPPKALDCVPGFTATELGLPIGEMPISFAWDQAGNGYVGSLKGRVLQILDTNEDGLEDDYQLISDELPTPYGLHAGPEGIDVLAKFGLLRLTPSNYGGTLRDWQVIADGWGYTQDYHDWAVGLERDDEGSYYLTLPCQQDDRSPAAAHLRGHALKLVKQATTESDRLYRVTSIAAGLRFPMGLALSSAGDLFASDNQGNYTPFNELNHLRVGKRYGFINKLENKNGFAPEFESPAINIPHPWMRSVNGICFLETPESSEKRGLFGPFEGHLLGCEMNGRCLVRMSLQSVAGQYQGAVYPFSLPPATKPLNFEGPIVCEVAPNGDVYVGNLKDSGWGGGNNTGSIVRLQPDGSWPLGIAEVRATREGLEVHFTQPVDRELALREDSYSIRSYQRTPTPAYGGDDQDVRTEEIQAVEVDDSGRLAILRLDELRQGAVYELNITSIGINSAPLFPSQAHYTMRAIPK